MLHLFTCHRRIMPRLAELLLTERITKIFENVLSAAILIGILRFKI